MAAYHFQLSDDTAMRYALSPVLDVTVGKPEFAVPSEGLLNPGQRYYWRVRAKSGEGVWGPWSAIWSFVPQGPGVPLHVRIDPDGPDDFVLRWDVNPSGRPAVQFRIYASNEKGFTVSDQPYLVATGNQKSRGLFPGEKSKIFPANRLGATSATQYKLRAAACVLSRGRGGCKGQPQRVFRLRRWTASFRLLQTAGGSAGRAKPSGMRSRRSLP